MVEERPKHRLYFVAIHVDSPGSIVKIPWLIKRWEEASDDCEPTCPQGVPAGVFAATLAATREARAKGRAEAASLAAVMRQSEATAKDKQQKAERAAAEAEGLVEVMAVTNGSLSCARLASDLAQAAMHVAIPNPRPRPMSAKGRAIVRAAISRISRILRMEDARASTKGDYRREYKKAHAEVLRILRTLQQVPLLSRRKESLKEALPGLEDTTVGCSVFHMQRPEDFDVVLRGARVWLECHPNPPKQETDR